MTELIDFMTATPVLSTFMQYLTGLEATSDDISGVFVGLTVINKCVKFCDPGLNRSGKIRPKAVGYGIFDRSLNFYKC